MTPRFCAGCGAPLPDTASSEPLTCRFCGVTHDRTAHDAPATITTIHIDRARASVPAVGAITVIATVLGLVAAVGGVIAAVATWRTSSPFTRTRPVATPSPPVALRVADLSRAGDGWHALAVAAPAGGFGAVDAITQVPWALAIAQGWSADARLERIDVVRLRPDGTVNVADDPDGALTWRFVSPGRMSDLITRAETSTRVDVPTQMHLEVRHGQVRAGVFSQGAAWSRTVARDLAALAGHPTSARPLSRLVPDLARRPEYTAPFLSGYLIHLEDEGWVWYFAPLGGGALPRVRASDGAVWPYRRAR